MNADLPNAFPPALPLAGEGAPALLVAALAAMGATLAVVSALIWLAPPVTPQKPVTIVVHEKEPPPPPRIIEVPVPAPAPPPTIIQVLTRPAPPPCFDPVTLMFATDKSEPLTATDADRAPLRERIARLSDWLGKHADARLLVAGYSDSHGTEAHNLVLSFARAKAVSSLLASKGIPASSMTVRAAGAGEAAAKLDPRTAASMSASRALTPAKAPPARRSIHEHTRPSHRPWRRVASAARGLPRRPRRGLKERTRLRGVAEQQAAILQHWKQRNASALDDDRTLKSTIEQVLAPLVERERLSVDLARVGSAGQRRDLSPLLELVAKVGSFGSVLLSNEDGLVVAAAGTAPDFDAMAAATARLTGAADQFAAHRGGALAVVVRERAAQLHHAVPPVHDARPENGSRPRHRTTRAWPAVALDPALAKIETALAAQVAG